MALPALLVTYLCVNLDPRCVPGYMNAEILAGGALLLVGHIFMAFCHEFVRPGAPVLPRGDYLPTVMAEEYPFGLILRTLHIAKDPNPQSLKTG